MSLTLYVSRSPQRSHDLELLLQNLRHHTSLVAGVNLRFDVNVADTELLNVLTATGTVKQTKDFLFFKRDLPKQTSSVPTAVTFRPHPQTTLSAAREVLARLKLYTPETLVDLLAAERLFLWEHEGKVASALHLEPVSNEGCQIIALATAPTLEGCGYAHALLSTVLAYCTGRYTRIELQVNAENMSAVRLYRKAGFVEVPSKAERWLYTTWS